MKHAAPPPALLAAALLAAAALVPGAALACSPAPGYRVPTNLELAAGADLILLGHVTGGTLDAGDPLSSTITVHPLAALQGAMPDGDIALAGMTLAEGEAAGYGALSNPYEFASAHPVSYIGGCIRYLFPRGTTALFFLDREGDAWVPAGGPFSRWAEDVPGEDAPWIELTRLYAHAVALPRDQRDALLAEESEALHARRDNPLAQLMAQDIDRQLAGPNAALVGDLPAFAGETGSGEPAQSSVEAALDAMRAGKGD